MRKNDTLETLYFYGLMPKKNKKIVLHSQRLLGRIMQGDYNV